MQQWANTGGLEISPDDFSQAEALHLAWHVGFWATEGWGFSHANCHLCWTCTSLVVSFWMCFEPYLFIVQVQGARIFRQPAGFAAVAHLVVNRVMTTKWDGCRPPEKGKDGASLILGVFLAANYRNSCPNPAADCFVVLGHAAYTAQKKVMCSLALWAFCLQ